MDYSPWGRKESDMTEQLNNNSNLEALVQQYRKLIGKECVCVCVCVCARTGSGILIFIAGQTVTHRPLLVCKVF